MFYVTISKISIAANSSYSIAGAMGGLEDSINQISLSSSPVMITGENGTGKEQIAQTIYIRSSFQSNPLVIIDCELLNDKSWEYLTNHYNSPFNDNNNTIYFKSIEVLPKERYQQLLSLIIDINLSKRNRLIFSCTSKHDALIPIIGQEFIKHLSCLTICLAPLRERAMEISSLSTLYLGSLNVELGKQLIGFEPKAMELLQQYEWPQNHTQFKRILTELSILTPTPYITSNSVLELLEKERKSFAYNYTTADNKLFDPLQSPKWSFPSNA